MANPVSASFNVREFQQTLRSYARESSKDFDQIVLEKSYQLAGGFGAKNPGALQLTRHADPARIAREMALSVTETQHTNKKGKVSIRRKLSFGSGDKNTLAARIVNWRRRKEGQPPLWGQKLDAASKALTQARVKSVNFVRSGWLASIQKLGPLIKKSGNVGGLRQKSRLKGVATTSGLGSNRPSVTVINRALNPERRGNPHVTPSRLKQMAEEGLGAAMQSVTRDMVRYMERKLQKTADKYSAR